MTATAPAGRTDSQALPLAGLQVVEFSHMVMGPTCGLILADLGAQVTKVEPLAGDNTRRLQGSGAGFFAAFNRNKRSLAVNVHDPRGLEVVLRLVSRCDVFSENFKAQTLSRLGLDYPSLAALNPGLIYVSHKGFLPGPYEHRTALDEVVQMMGGLAYMTGPSGRPLRAGSSINDIMGGMFGAIGALAALAQRQYTGRGQQVQSALFENNVLLMAQHMMQLAVTGRAADPMPERISAWGIYDVFTVADESQIFLAVVSDTQWEALCEDMGWSDWREDPRLRSNNDRVQARSWWLPVVRERLRPFTAAELAQRFERKGLPYAPIARPQDLLQDPHLQASGGLVEMDVPADASCAGHDMRVRVPLLPLTLDGQRLGVRSAPPAQGEHTREVLSDLGYAAHEIHTLLDSGVVGQPATHAP